MPGASQTKPLSCANLLSNSLRLRATFHRHGCFRANSTQSSPLPQDNVETTEYEEVDEKKKEGGRMSERLSQMTEEFTERGDREVKKAISEGGFSEELRKKLEARIQASTFRNENPAAFAEINMPVRLDKDLTKG